MIRLTQDTALKMRVDSHKQLNGQLFLVMTDQQALQQMQNFFTQWRENPRCAFPLWAYEVEGGLHPSPYDPTIGMLEDRIRETGVLEDWQDRLQSDQDVVPFEAELWFREDSTRRQQAESHLHSIIASLDGEVGPAMCYSGNFLPRDSWKNPVRKG